MTPRICSLLGASLLIFCQSPGNLGRAQSEGGLAESPQADANPGAAANPSKGALVLPAAEKDQPGPRCHRERFAVCIGINRYQEDSGFKPLSHAANDAVELAEVLASVCDFEHILLMCDTPSLEELERRSETWVNKKEEKEDETKIVIVPDVSYRSIDDQVYQFLRRSKCPDDLVLFFFSGHGESPPNNPAYLVPSDYPARNLPMIYVCTLLGVSPIQASWKVVLLDACRAGHAMKAKCAVDLERAGKQGGLFIMTSCRENEDSYEEPSLAHSTFSWALIDSIRALGANPQDDVWFQPVFRGVHKRFEDKGWARLKPQNPLLFSGVSSHPDFFPLRRPRPTASGMVDAEGVAKVVKGAREAYAADRLEAALNQYDTCVSSLPQLQPAAKLSAAVEGNWRAEYARTLYRLNHRKAAEKQLELAKQLNPGSVAVAECEGFALVDGGQYEAAEKKFALAIAASSDTASQRYLQASRGMTLRQLGRYDEAAAALTAAARASSDTGQKLRYYSLVADCRFRAGQPEEALRLVSVYRRVLDDVTKDPPNSIRRAQTYHWGSVLLQALNRNKDAATERDEGVKILTEALGKDYPLNVGVPRFLEHLQPDGS